MLQLAPFLDYGNAWNFDPTPAEPRATASVGVGLLWSPVRHLQTQFHLAIASRTIRQATKDLQDKAVHFLVSYQFF